MINALGDLTSQTFSSETHIVLSMVLATAGFGNQYVADGVPIVPQASVVRSTPAQIATHSTIRVIDPCGEENLLKYHEKFQIALAQYEAGQAIEVPKTVRSAADLISWIQNLK